MTYHAAYEPQRGIRTDRWKYIRRFDDYQYHVLPNCDDSSAKDLLLQSGWADRTVDQEQLYDLVIDPEEGRNLACEPSHKAVVESLAGRLHSWMVETNDPLLKGRVPAPVGATLNDQSQVSPSEPVRRVTAREGVTAP